MYLFRHMVIYIKRKKLSEMKVVVSQSGEFQIEVGIRIPNFCHVSDGIILPFKLYTNIT